MPKKSKTGKKGKVKLDKHTLLAKQKKRDILSEIKETENVDRIVELTWNQDDEIRLKAVQELCPCKVQKDIDEFWNRLFQLVEDPCDEIRLQVLHNLCDGSPPHLEYRIKEALDIFNSDSNKEIRRKAHKALGSYLRTGDWNVL